MTTRIGADDDDLFEVHRPGLLQQVTGIEPEPSAPHVRFEVRTRIRSTQRLALAALDGGVIVGLWPAELKPQAEYLFQAGRATRMVAAALELGWSVTANPHLAFRNARPSQRLYLNPSVDAGEYAKRWEGADGRRIGQYSPDEVRRMLWPWLKERGYVSSGGDEVLEEFLSILGRRPAHLRPGLRLQGRWDAGVEQGLTEPELAVAIRREVNAVLGAAGEPQLPVTTGPVPA